MEATQVQSWIVPGTPLADGWHLWYATDGVAPEPARVLRGGLPVAINWQVTGPIRLAGFDRSIYRARLRLPADEPRGASYHIHIPETGEQYQWSTLPASLPPDGLSLLFGSCFWQQDDAEGELLRACQDIIKLEASRPVFKLLLGDQIYLDWPPDVAPWRLQRGGYRLVGERYQRYWGDDAYRAFLGLLPNLMAPDDHEFWNDYPEPQIQLPVTWQAGLRDEFAAAAHDYFHAFQGLLNPEGGEQAWTIVSLPPASLFVADTRSERSHADHQPPQVMSPAQWAALEDWQHQLRGPGLLAIGQPLFQDDGDWRDHSLSNFPAEYRRLLALLRRSAIGDNAHGEPHNIVLLTGDIHNARSTCATIPGIKDDDFKYVYELVASASSAIGPYLTTPKPSALPLFLPPGGADSDFSPRWPVQAVKATAPFDPVAPGNFYADVDNNLGVLRLRPHPKQPYAVELTHVSYRVRPYRKPYLEWRRAARDTTVGAGRLIHSHVLNLR
ncbi:alkaline phosphatase D family protein [Alcaligenaceae bacterium]|nr:alkaline phosphatase D family protein [Alcaligenaceae bacterium]